MTTPAALSSAHANFLRWSVAADALAPLNRVLADLNDHPASLTDDQAADLAGVLRLAADSLDLVRREVASRAWGGGG